MTNKEFRAALAQHLQSWQSANYPALPLVYENGPVPDELTIGPVWLDFEIRWYAGNNITMGINPIGRSSGVVSLMVFHRSGAGTGLSDDIVDSLLQAFRNTAFGSGRLEFPQRVVPTELKGWHKTGLLIPFYLDSA